MDCQIWTFVLKLESGCGRKELWVPFYKGDCQSKIKLFQGAWDQVLTHSDIFLHWLRRLNKVHIAVPSSPFRKQHAKIRWAIHCTKVKQWRSSCLASCLSTQPLGALYLKNIKCVFTAYKERKDSTRTPLTECWNWLWGQLPGLDHSSSGCVTRGILNSLPSVRQLQD